MSEEIKISQEEELAMTKRRWKNRRYMAWIALVSILVVTAIVFFIIPEKRLALIGDVANWFFTIMGTIVGAYMGLATMEDIKKK